MRPVLAIAATELRRFLRDRSNIFFVFVFPILLIALIGSQFGGGAAQGRVSIAGSDSALREDLSTALAADGVNVTFASADAVREQLARGRSDVGLFIDAAASTAFDAGQDIDLEVVLGTQSGSQAAVQRVRTALDSLALARGQEAALVAAGAPAADVPAALDRAESAANPPTLTVVDTSDIAQEFGGVGGFDVGASSQLLLFVFLSSMAGSAALIQSRKNGVVARTLASPVSAAQAVAGQALGRWTIAITQGVYIMAGSALLFGVQWGNVGLVVVVLAIFALVAAGAGMVIGSVLDNEGAASGLGVGVSLVLAALGGCMFPLELFPETLRTIAHVTPHTWAYQALAEIQRHGGTLADVAPYLGVLAGFAAVLLALGAWTLRRSLERAI